MTQRQNTNNTTVTLGAESRNKLLEGVNTVANAVKTTLGPSGRTAVYTHFNGVPVSTKDGVSVAKSIVIDDNEIAVGAEMIKQISLKVGQEAGDGTTTSTILGQAIANKGVAAVANGMNPVHLKRGIDKACDFIVNEIKNNSIACTTVEDVYNVAKISANNDDVIASTIARTYEAIGKDGLMSFKMGTDTEDKVELQMGITINKGYAHDNLINNRENTFKSEQVFILLVEDKINNYKEIYDIVNTVVENGFKLLILADDFSSDTLDFLGVNVMKGNAQISAVKLMMTKELKDEYLKDIKTLTSAEIIGKHRKYNLQNFDFEKCFGVSREVEVTKEKTIIASGNFIKEEVIARAEEVKATLKIYKETKNQFFIQKTKERLAALTGGIAVIKVGGYSEIEIKERYDRYEDAICAYRSAIEEGVIAGGGTALAKISKKLSKLKGINIEEDFGIKIVVDSIKEPLRQILSNCGLEHSIIIDKILKKNDFNYGYDALNNKYVNVLETGIIDPAKVTRCAIQSSCSVANSIITTECVIARIKE